MYQAPNSTFTPGVLKGKVIVITGASSGVGHAAALAFARHGTRLVLAARREEALKDVVKQCEKLGSSAIAVITDVTKSAEVKQLAEKAVEFGGRLDVWVNNAGVLAAGSFSDTPVEVHDQVIRTNLMGYIYGAHAALPYFKKQGSGVLIKHISVGGWFPTPFMTGYSASKFALRGFSESLRGELTRWPGIYVCNLFPAFLDTPGIQHAGNYSGTVLRPAPPIYDPQRVARAMIAVAKYPRNSVAIGSAASFLRVVHFLLPTLSAAITAKVIETYFKKGESTEATSGNLFHPVEFGISIHGGWSKPVEPATKRRAVAVTVTGLLAAWLIAGQLKKRL